MKTLHRLRESPFAIKCIFPSNRLVGMSLEGRPFFARGGSSIIEVFVVISDFATADLKRRDIGV